MKFKPCPFCGSEPKYEVNGDTYNFSCSNDDCILSKLIYFFTDEDAIIFALNWL